MRIRQDTPGNGQSDRIDSAAEGTNPGNHADDRSRDMANAMRRHVTDPLRLEATATDSLAG